MPKLAFSVANPLSQQEAMDRLKQFLPRVREHYGEQISNLQESWEGNELNFRFTTFGIDIAGLLRVNEPDVRFEGELPFTAMMFKGKIESSIRQELAKLLS